MERTPADPVDPAAFAALRDRALGFLARREHGVRELEIKLAAKGADPPLVRAVIEELAAKGLLSDERYAAAYARHAIRSRPKPERRIVAELVERRVPAAVAARAVRETFVEEDVDDAALARQVARKRAAQLGAGEATARLRRLGRYLQARGFSPGLVAEVCSEALPDIDAESSFPEPDE